jgi:hypothetical protein
VIDFLVLVAAVHDRRELALSIAVAATDAAEPVFGQLLAQVVRLLGDAFLDAHDVGAGVFDGLDDVLLAEAPVVGGVEDEGDAEVEGHDANVAVAGGGRAVAARGAG